MFINRNNKGGFRFKSIRLTTRDIKQARWSCEKVPTQLYRFIDICENWNKFMVQVW